MKPIHERMTSGGDVIVPEYSPIIAYSDLIFDIRMEKPDECHGIEFIQSSMDDAKIESGDRIWVVSAVADSNH